MKITVTKIVFLALTLILIPSTTAAKGSRGDREYRGDKEHNKGKEYHKDKDHDDDRDDHKGKDHHNDKRYHRDKGHEESKGYHKEDGHHGKRGEHGRRLLSKIRLQTSVCKDVDGKWARGLCYAYCEALDCDGTEGTNPRGSANACMKLKENYYKRTNSPLPCMNVPAASCPCYGDLDKVFIGPSPSCSPVEEPTFVFDSNGTQAQASVDPRFLACAGVNGITKLDSLEEATSCLKMIQDFCLVGPVP